MKMNTIKSALLALALIAVVAPAMAQDATQEEAIENIADTAIEAEAGEDAAK